MSWFNLNDSLSNIKGQITNFASEVLADDVETKELDEAKKRIKELEELCGAQQKQIEELQNFNQQLEKHKEHEPQFNLPEVADLKRRIADLEGTKKELENALVQLDLDCQQTVDKLISLKDDLQLDYTKLEEEHAACKTEEQKRATAFEENAKELQVLQEERKVLLERNAEALNKLESNEKQLEEALKHLKFFENKAQTEQTNTDQNELQLGEVSKENEALQKEISLKNQYIQTLEEENKQLSDAKRKFEEYKAVAEKENYDHIEALLKKYEARVRDLENQLHDAHESGSELRNELSEIQAEKLRMHKTYLNILAESMEKYVNYENAADFEHENEAHFKEFTNQVDKIIRLLLDFKQKTESLEKELYELKEENSKVITEKNNDIEKLLQNSEILSQEVITKTQTLKEYESECSELVKNNDLLIAELQTLKRSGLQTISESNEDSLVLLEAQLDKAHRRIRDLELTVSDYEKRDCNFETNIELEYIKKQLNITGTELNQCKSEYFNLLEKYAMLERECKGLRKQEGKVKEAYDVLKREDEQLRSTVEKLTAEVETNEYQYAELQMNEDSLKEDVEKLRSKCEELGDLNQKLRASNEEYAHKAEEFQEQNSFSLSDEEYAQKMEEVEDLKQKYAELITVNQQLMTGNEECTARIKEIENKSSSETALSKTLEELKEQNRNLQVLQTETQEKLLSVQIELENMKQQLHGERESKEQLELQLRNLEEKLQNAKMSETSLKWQIDTMHKELQALSDAKANLEMNFNNLMHDLQTNQNNLLVLQQRNDALQGVCDEMEHLKPRNDQLVAENVELLDKLSFSEDNLRKTLAENAEMLRNLKINQEKCGDLERKLSMDVDEIVQQKELHEQLEVSEKKRVELEGKLKTLNLENVRNELLTEESSFLESKFTTLNLNEDPTNKTQREEYTKTVSDLQLENQKIADLEKQIQDLTLSRNELIAIVTTKHEESVMYHNEIQRLTQILNSETEKVRDLTHRLETINNNNELVQRNDEEMDKLRDQNVFLKEKCEVLAQNLLQEQSNVQKVLAERSSASDKEQGLTKELERLRVHLVEIEDMYTQELLQAEQKNKMMESKMNEIEEREKNSSTMYTSVSIRANQQVEALQSQIQQLKKQREELQKKISDAEDENSRSAAALRNLQFVLEQFQKDKENDVQQETERLRRQIKAEQRQQVELRNEIASLRAQLEETRSGLQAAARLSDQLEFSKQQVITLKEEVKKLQEKLTKAEEKHNALISQTDSKIDKTLIKNLVLGFVATNNNYNKDQLQILKIIATVLDFNQQELDKANLNKSQQGSWLSSLLHPQGATGVSQQSLSEAFVRFLEQESKPRVLPNLLNAGVSKEENGLNGGAKKAPVVLSEIMLPTFADFAQSRNSSSILKDVLKDNS